MLRANDLMKKKIQEANSGENLPESAVLQSIVDKTKLINDCIIYDADGTLREEKINFDRALRFNGDWTGYEAGCNELRFDLEELEPSCFTAFANSLSLSLSQKYNRSVAVYISLYEDSVDVRFHTYREYEIPWLVEDLNEYDEPILCCIAEL